MEEMKIAGALALAKVTKLMKTMMNIMKNVVFSMENMRYYVMTRVEMDGKVDILRLMEQSTATF